MYITCLPRCTHPVAPTHPPRCTQVSATSVYFRSTPYDVDPSTGLIDYDSLAEKARVLKPKLIIAGGSAYPREWDYKRMRQIADEVGAYLMTDMVGF